MIQILFYCLVTSMGQYSVLLTNVNCNHLAINISLQDFSLPPLGFRSQEMDLGLSLPLVGLDKTWTLAIYCIIRI